jgi:hypothetical protein
MAELNPKLMHELGRMMVFHATLESALRIGISLQAVQNSTLVLTLLSRMMFGQLLEKFEVTMRERYPARDTDIHEFCESIGKLNTRRNNLVHSFWTIEEETKAMKRHKMEAKRGDGLTLNSLDVKPEDVRALNDELIAASNKTWELVIDLTTPREQK